MMAPLHRGVGAVLFLSVVATASIAAPVTAHAETRREYINRYALLVDWVTRSELWVTRHLEDTGLCRLAQSVAERQVQIARRMTPPTEFVAIHPHLLLVMENAERMFALAAAGDRVGFRRHRRVVHEEQRIIAEVLQAEGRVMPVINP